MCAWVLVALVLPAAACFERHDPGDAGPADAGPPPTPDAGDLRVVCAPGEEWATCVDSAGMRYFPPRVSAACKVTLCHPRGTFPPRCDDAGVPRCRDGREPFCWDSVAVPCEDILE